jgi:transposase, IS5 family
MGRSAGFFDVEERLAGLSKKGDDLERLAAVVDFELFRPELERAVPRADRSKGGRPPFDHVLMFKVLILQSQNNLSDERTEFSLRDRLTAGSRRFQRHAPVVGRYRPLALPHLR